jgi:hypothetical protein
MAMATRARDVARQAGLDNSAICNMVALYREVGIFAFRGGTEKQKISVGTQ